MFTSHPVRCQAPDQPPEIDTADILANMNPDPKIIQPKGLHTHTIVLLHGRDSNAEEFSQEFFECQVPDGRGISQILSTFKWVFPSAKTIPSKQFGCEMSQWFDMQETPVPRIDECDYADDLASATKYIIDILAKEAQIIGLGNLMIGGISQGCAMAIYALLRGGQRLGGFIGLSGWLPRPLVLQRLIKKKNEALQTPVFLAHNQDDEVVSIANSRQTYRWCAERWGMDVEFCEFPEGGHWINEPECVRRLTLFIAKTADPCDIAKVRNKYSE